ncbi:MAG: mannosyltransferase family protein [Solirubrobacteraceae bacterium]
MCFFGLSGLGPARLGSSMQRAIAQADPAVCGPAADPRGGGCGATVWRAIWTSRLVVLAAGVLAMLQVGPAVNWRAYDPTGLTAPFGYFPNLLLAPVARWDSVWYLTIAQRGYDHQLARAAFFPLYPLLMHVVALAIGSELVAGLLISLVSFAIGLVALHRLVRLELDPARADLTVMLIAFCPMAFFFSAVYSESLFLALSVGAILRARRGRWTSAAVLGALAAASRSTGVLLLVPIAILYLYGPRADQPLPTSRWAASGFARWRRLLPRQRLSISALWLALVPLGLGAYLAYLGITTGNALAPFHAEAIWYHHFAGPFGGVSAGAVAAWDGLRQLLHGPPPPIYFTKAGGDPLIVAGQNLMLFAFLVLGAIALLGVFRRLPFAYGAYVLVSLAAPLSEPVSPQPLSSLPRYELVLFPLFMWGASLIARRRWASAALAALAVLLGLFTAEFATWRFVA